MIYLGNGLYSDSGHSLMHYGIKNMRWDPSKRKTNVDWSDPEEVAAYYNRTAGQATRNVTNGVRTLYSRAGAAAARPISLSSAVGKHAMDIYRVSGRQNRYNRRPSPDVAQAVGRAKADEEKSPRGGFVTPRSPRDVKNRADTIKQPTGGFVTPRPNYTSGRAKADEEKSPRGGFVTPRSSAERRAADDRAHGPRGGFVAPRPDYVIRDQNDKKRGPHGGPHFATKEHYQEQVNARMRKKSADDYRKSFNDQVDRKGHGTLNDWYETDHKLYVGERGNHKRGNKTDRYVDVNKAIEAGRRRAQNKKTEERNLNAGIAAGRERRRNAENAKRGVQSTAAYNRAMKAQEQRGSGTLADYNTQRFSSAKTQKRNADNTNAGITAGRNRATLKKAEDAYNKKLAEEKAKKKANSPYNKTKNAFVKGSEDIVGSAYDAYKKGKKKLKKFFG